MSGNIIISCHMTITLFKFDIKTHDISKLKFVDFEEHFSADLSFCPSTICLNEDILSCSSKENLQVIQVVIADTSKGSAEDKKKSRRSLEGSRRPDVKRQKSPSNYFSRKPL